MVPSLLNLPFAELEVGQHLYWQIGNLNLHGQVFLSSWVVIGLLLLLVVSGTRKMERDPKGVQNLLEYLWDYLRELAREQIGEKAAIEEDLEKHQRRRLVGSENQSVFRATTSRLAVTSITSTGCPCSIISPRVTT